MRVWIAAAITSFGLACKEAPPPAPPAPAPQTPPPAAQAEKAIDPVCEMEIDTAGAITRTHEGKTYYFCSESCRQRFKDDPAQFLKP